jgi:Xaa-Pro aminopeptidase
MLIAALRNGILLLALLLLNLDLLAQKEVPQDYLPASFHKGRREAARVLMPENSVMVVFAAPTRNFSNDVDYLYHPNPDLYYFTGYKEPNAVLLLFKEAQKAADGSLYNEVFFVQKKDARLEQWTGRRMGPEGVKEHLGFSTVYNGDDFSRFAPDFSTFSKVLVGGLYEDAGNNRRDTADLFDLISQFKSKAGYTNSNTDRFDIQLFKEITGQLREIKTPEELVLLRKAVEISCKGQNEVMKAVRPDMSELEIQGLHEYVHKIYGAEGVGYGSIVGAGENGCILHYMENTKTKIGTDMLLMDVGAEYHGYTADVTRTIPADGKFSPEERAIYQLVYDAQEAAFAILKDGARWEDASNAARDFIATGLVKLKIIKNKEDVKKYYPHGLMHHIGLDVHDRGFSKTLKKGMVVTVEPGIYIPENSPVDKKWWGIAVRIEDDVLIREKDYELLSHFAPRSIEAIEKLISEKSILDNYRLPPLQSTERKVTEKKAF